jgi:hypothetical protein
MRAVALVDTSILCELLEVPGKCQSVATIKTAMTEKVAGGEALLLPMTAVLETGNHIGQIDSGGARREYAKKLAKTVIDALDGASPFAPMSFWDRDRLRIWLAEFPDRAAEGMGLGDLAIVKDWERACQLHAGRRVYVWTLDPHLSSYDRPPEVR